MADRLYFRQLLSGRDFAVGDPVASQMVNFVYAIGDRSTGECVLVDPAYAVDDLVDTVEADGMVVGGVLATHYHPDHVGGSMMGYTIEGVAGLLERVSCPVHVQRDEAPWVARTTGVAESELVAHDPGDGSPSGRSRSSSCTRPATRRAASASSSRAASCRATRSSSTAAAAPTCPAAMPALMYDSLQRLATLPADTIVFPGHRYSMPSSASMEAIREQNYVYRPSSKDQWMTMFGR